MYTVSTTVFSTQANRAAATFTLSVQPNGNVQLLSHHPSYFGWAVSTTSNIDGRSCNPANSSAVNVTRQSVPTGYAPTAWTYQPSLSSSNQYDYQAVENPNTAPYQSERIVIESLAARGQYVMVSGGGTTGGLIAAAPTLSSWALQANGFMLAPTSFSWGLTPPLGCPAVCTAGVATLSLLGANGSGTVVFDYGGGVYVGAIGSGYGSGDDSLVTYVATVNGVTGYVLSSLNDFAVGNVWTLQPSGAVLSQPVSAGGLSVSNLWRLFWEDGSGDLLWSGFPTVPAGEAGEPACPSMSATPSSTTTQTPTQTP